MHGSEEDGGLQQNSDELYCVEQTDFDQNRDIAKGEGSEAQVAEGGNGDERRKQYRDSVAHDICKHLSGYLKVGRVESKV